MNAMMRRVVIGTAAVSMALTMAACGKAGSDTKASSGDSKTVGLLLPENSSSVRYESFDKPLITAKIKDLCADCDVKYNNANGDAATQKQQFDTLVSQGVKVILLDAVNAKGTESWVTDAAKKGVKVIAYDRLAAGPVAAYISFDNEKVGELQGQALITALGANASQDSIVMINGDDADPNAGQFKAGAHKVLDTGVKKIAYEQSGQWQPTVASQKMGAAITALGKTGFQGVYSANDGMAAAIITALKAAGITNVPVGGQDAASDAIQRLLTGDQAYTIYKAYKPEAEGAATIAVNLLHNLSVSGVATTMTASGSNSIPSLLLTPVVVTKANIQSTVIADGLYKASDICTAQYADACKAAGIQ
ncbi:sugar ABC transporter substrate-binding protein [Kitasatospora mediocidica]|uniref:sugar ABC transporter substrate-binding protein n=1 Tax=Kitasatospora mediocidica TaxID=58352 RepID=UPI00055F1BE5|nr:substrate-binding domain-containing protein [Kitasatospora mediocidica]